MSGWVTDVEDWQDDDLSVVVLELGDDDLGELFVVKGEGHAQERVGVELVVDVEGIFGDGVDQWRSFGHLIL